MNFRAFDRPKTVALLLSCFCLKFYRLPTTRCENGLKILSSFTVNRHEKNATVLGVFVSQRVAINGKI